MREQGRTILNNNVAIKAGLVIFLFVDCITTSFNDFIIHERNHFDNTTLYQGPVVQAERADAAFDFEESDGLIKYFGWKIGDFHDCFAGTEPFRQGSKDQSFNVGVADQVLFFKFLVIFDVIVREEEFENILWLGVGNRTLLNQLITALRVGISDIARDSKDIFALFECVSGSV